MTGYKKRDWAGTKQAQKMFPLTRCELCGGTTTLQRHHKDRNKSNNNTGNVAILCQACHAAEHIKAGDWGKGQVRLRHCVICGAEFQPKRTRRGKLCGRPECRREMGRRSAAKRWSSQGLQQALQTV